MMKSKFIFLAFVMPFLTIFVSSLMAQDVDVLKEDLPFKMEIPNFSPKGVFALLNWGDTTNRKVLKAILKNPCIDGIRIGRYWYQLNPEDDQYNFYNRCVICQPTVN